MSVLKGNAIVGQSGGPTAAINATLSGVIRGAIANENIGTLYGACRAGNMLIKDENGNSCESAPHPKQKLFIDLGIALDKYDILRRKEE